MALQNKRGLRSFPNNGTVALANNGVEPKNVGGNFLFVAAADQAFKVVFSNGSEFPATKNFKVKFAAGSEFDSFEIVNDSGSTLNYRIIAGFGDVDLAADTIDSITNPVVTTGGKASTYGVSTIGTSNSQVITADDNTTGWMIQADHDNTDDIYLGDDNSLTTANAGHRLKAGAAIGWDFRGDVYAISGSASQKVRYWKTTVS